MKKYLFRNDYSFGAHPKVLEAVCAVNLEGNHGYGDDGYTARAKDRIREVCGCPDAMVEFLIGGTQTNVVACRVADPSVCTVIAGGREYARAVLPLFEFGRTINVALPRRK